MTEEFLHTHLRKRDEQGLLRQLKVNKGGLVDFCSNDYLGFARSEELFERISDQFPAGTGTQPPNLNGSTGSRLLSGNTAFAEELERFIASYHHAEAGLIFNSGYDANIGLFSSVPKRGDTILYDELIHASAHDGMRLSFARSVSFRHNDMKDLEKKLEKSSGHIFIAVEAVYSMDGDFAPLEELIALSGKYGARLIVDEAHATGIFGKRGEGRCAELGIEKKVFARVHTFGKALGVHGAIVLGSEHLRNHQVNFARPFIYSTALPYHSLLGIKCAYEFLEDSNAKKMNLLKNILLIKRLMGSVLQPSSSQIQSIIISGNKAAKSKAEKAQQAGFDVRAILSPTVPEGKERLRICIHSFNTEEEITQLSEMLTKEG